MGSALERPEIIQTNRSPQNITRRPLLPFNFQNTKHSLTSRGNAMTVSGLGMSTRASSQPHREIIQAWVGQTFRAMNFSLQTLSLDPSRFLPSSVRCRRKKNQNWSPSTRGEKHKSEWRRLGPIEFAKKGLDHREAGKHQMWLHVDVLDWKSPTQPFSF